MIGLHFDLLEKQNQLEVTHFEKKVTVIVHNGYSYSRIVFEDFEQLEKFINDLKRNSDETQFIQ